MSCPPLEALAGYFAQSISAAERVEIGGHLSTCSGCLELAAQVENRSDWELQELRLISGVSVDVLIDSNGGARCGDRLCRHLVVQPGLPGLGGETRRCALLDAAPPPPPHDYCQPFQIEIAVLLDRARRTPATSRGGSR